MYYELIVLGLVSLAAPWLAKLAGYEMTRKPFDVVGVAGIFFLLTAAFGMGFQNVAVLASITSVAQTVALVIGWILMIIGGIWGILDVFREPHRGMVSQKT